MSSNRKRSSSSSSDDLEQNNGRELPNTARRDDNSISFRHFLQQQSDVVPTNNPRRPPRTNNAALVDLVDIHGGLPDFVQDHLVVEGQVGGGGEAASHEAHPIPNPVSPLDLALINEMMPNLLNSSPRHSNNAPGGERLEAEDLGAYGPAVGGPSLPDFLSDGPMHCDATSSSSTSDTQGRSARFLPSRCSTGSLGRSQLRTSSQNTDVLLQQIQRLEHEVESRDRKIQELENLIFEQKAELVGLYEQIAENQQIEVNRKPITEPVAPIACQERSHLHAEANYNGREHNNHSPIGSRRVHEVATRAESLIAELLKEIRQLRDGDC